MLDQEFVQVFRRDCRIKVFTFIDDVSPNILDNEMAKDRSGV